ncbi:hypothetical protein B484DRAFT_395966 [Ochromonadaceae sp. CCMP2298]|nr:hypothetical protein B484DRAFT_396850 [Ochromonadaceae sp. CCMP2298]KAJ1430273.1 hypothetical protein B484DRAFT_395966 [Ochromonadaceae sp. CCMP2298]
MPPKKQPGKSVLARCEDLIKTFNPVTHSIDTHCAEVLGDVKKADALPESVLVQQIVYGWHKERASLKAFIDEFYGDNASRVLRVDMTMYAILAYMTVYRLQEMGVRRYREICSSQEPSKISFFVSYVFNKENLWNTLRSAWMKVLDLEFVEKTMIPRLEKFIPEMTRYSIELDSDALSNAAAEALIEEAKAKGEAGVTKVASRCAAPPVSPRLSKTRPPLLPEPEKIVNQLEAKPVPAFINNTSLARINEEAAERTKNIRLSTTAAYKKSLEFRFHESKGGRPISEIKAEIEEERQKHLFVSSFYNPAPDFSNAPDIRINVSTILKEDALFRKQQAKDATILRNYEEELRDPFDYYLWQKDLRDRDHVEKLQGVALRREQAKQSAVEAREAILRQREDNITVANLMREQSGVIKRQKELEDEIEMLRNQEVVQGITAVRDTAPAEATRKIAEKRVEIGRLIREDLERARAAKIEEDREGEEVKADKIRQLRALNTVHKEHIVVFDPTLHAGIGLLDEMSYMEMQVRRRQEKEREEEVERVKRVEISRDKERKMSVLDKRKEVIMRARDIKAQAHKVAREREQTTKKREEEEVERARAVAQVALGKVLAAKAEAHRVEQAALKAEQDKIKRQQQYLGAAMGQVEELRDAQVQQARERQAMSLERDARLSAEGIMMAKSSDRANKLTETRLTRRMQVAGVKERDLLVEREKKVSLEKIKTRVIDRKAMFEVGQRQHETTRTVRIETNPYANSISEESLTKVRTQRSSSGSGVRRVQIIG